MSTEKDDKGFWTQTNMIVVTLAAFVGMLIAVTQLTGMFFSRGAKVVVKGEFTSFSPPYNYLSQFKQNNKYVTSEQVGKMLPPDLAERRGLAYEVANQVNQVVPNVTELELGLLSSFWTFEITNEGEKEV